MKLIKTILIILYHIPILIFAPPILYFIERDTTLAEAYVEALEDLLSILEEV